ncbi:MAG TPA: L,D-transpeptidase [Gemmatimonadaceae bacterium]|nr:L,D-transpeptidase [Gemmatimonadaceae bacterium]
MSRLLAAVVATALLCAPARPTGMEDAIGIAPYHAGTVAVRGEGIRLDLNVPAYRLSVILDDSVIARYLTAVGMPGYRTPLGSFSITRAEWNPWWYPPDAAWARNERVTPPGPANPMGRVKLLFKPSYFIHGTPAEQSLGSAASHGCVRMANDDAIVLALLLQRVVGADISEQEMDSVLASRTRTRTVVLAEAVPLEIRYDLAEIERDSLRVYPDVYRRAPSGSRSVVMDVLLRAGVDTAAVDGERLAGVVARGARRAAAIAIDDLLRSPLSGGDPDSHRASEARSVRAADSGASAPARSGRDVGRTVSGVAPVRSSSRAAPSQRSEGGCS